MTKTKPQASPSGKLSNSAKNKLQSLFKAQGIEKPISGEAVITSASKRRWSANQVTGKSPSQNVLKLQVTGPKHAKPTVDEAPKTVLVSDVIESQPTKSQKRRAEKQLKKKAVAENLAKIKANVDKLSYAIEIRHPNKNTVAATAKHSIIESPKAAAENGQPKKANTPKKKQPLIAQNQHNIIENDHNQVIAVESTTANQSQPLAKNLKRLSKSSKASPTLSSHDLVKALKKKLAPNGGFVVESIPTAEESPEAFSLVPFVSSGPPQRTTELRRTSNGFVVEELSDSLEMEADYALNSDAGEEIEEVEEEEECNDSECDCRCSCTTESCDSASIGSDAEEILSDADADSMDWSDSYSSGSEADSDDSATDYSTDESCPQLIPIGAEDADTSESSDAESCPQLVPIGSECDSDGWCNVDSDDENEVWTTSGGESDSQTDASSEAATNSDSWDSNSYSEDDYETASSASDEPSPYDADPMFFETVREPLIVTVGHTADTQWAACPLTVDEANDAPTQYEPDTSIQAIVQSVQRSQKRRRTDDVDVQPNVSRAKFADRLAAIQLDEQAEAVSAEVKEPLVDVPEPSPGDSASPVADSAGSPIDDDPPAPFDAEPANGNDDSQYDPFEGIDAPPTDATSDWQQHDDDTGFVSTAANKPRFYNALNSRQVLLVLKAELYFHGILDVQLLAGNVRIYGYQLRTDQPVRAHSPRGQSFLSMTPGGGSGSGGDADELHNGATADLDAVQAQLVALRADFLNGDIYEAIEAFESDAGDALLLLEAADRRSPPFHMLDKYMRQAVFPNSAAFNVHRPFYSSEFILRTQFYTRPRTKLTIGRQWLGLDVGRQPGSRTVVLGGKGVGKSTYVRYLVNGAVQQHGAALLIDLDIGQPELFVPQCIAATCVREPLLGAGYMQARRPDRALLFGEINVTIAPLKYLRCVLRLLRECAQNPDWAEMPWVVNTMGYNRGFGLEMMAAVLRVFAMTDVVQIQSQRRLDNYERVLSAEMVNGLAFKFFGSEVERLGGEGGAAATHRTHVLRSMARRFGDRTADWDMSAKDARLATVLAGLAGMLGDDGNEWLTDVRPVCAPLDSLKVIVANETVAPDQVLNLLNGNLVYLCRQTDEDADAGVDDNIECLGIGIVRGVDHIERTVYLLPAVDRARLAQVNCLAVCNTPLPTSLVQNHSARVRGRIPYAYNTNDFIGSKQIVRISYRPDGTPRKN